MSKRSRPPDDPQLSQLVRTALGKTGEKLSDPELDALAREFVRAGANAVRLEHTRSTREASRLMVDARARLTRARIRAAETSRPGRVPGIIVPPRWRQTHRAMQANIDDLLNRPGVVGCGISYRRRDGLELPERCVTVMVEEKIPLGKLKGRPGGALPEWVQVGGVDVPVDVVETGEFQLKSIPGASVGPTGTKSFATLGCFARDLSTTEIVALTAMHVLENGPREYPGQPPRTDELLFSAPCDGEQGSRRLGRLLFGTQTWVDAAKIRVDGGPVSNHIPGLGRIGGWRPIDVEADRSIPVALYGAASRGVKRGDIRIPLAQVKELPNLGPCIVAAIDVPHGDSGAALVDSACIVLGLLVGGGKKLNAFSPIGDVLASLDCDIRPQL